VTPFVITALQGIVERAGAHVTVNYANSSQVNQAIQYAKQADVAIVVVGITSGEGSDRPNLELGSGQDQLVQAIAAVQPNTGARARVCACAERAQWSW
jgi:beta-glucosidase